jgi:hypothetical protein
MFPLVGDDDDDVEKDDDDDRNIVCRKIVFPDPDGPIIPTTCPLGIIPLVSCNNIVVESSCGG